uniref:Uncharacterized protein n=1 Tax=Mycena chlorophos TaxID=658473 RepID=A0ABQ0LY89_MYCCL|nr:predicted protein [Mycena chlorophos]
MAMAHALAPFALSPPTAKPTPAGRAMSVFDDCLSGNTPREVLGGAGRLPRPPRAASSDMPVPHLAGLGSSRGTQRATRVQTSLATPLTRRTAVMLNMHHSPVGPRHVTAQARRRRRVRRWHPAPRTWTTPPRLPQELGDAQVSLRKPSWRDIRVLPDPSASQHASVVYPRTFYVPARDVGNGRHLVTSRSWQSGTEVVGDTMTIHSPTRTNEIAFHMPSHPPSTFHVSPAHPPDQGPSGFYQYDAAEEQGDVWDCLADVEVGTTSVTRIWLPQAMQQCGLTSLTVFRRGFVACFDPGISNGDDVSYPDLPLLSGCIRGSTHLAADYASMRLRATAPCATDWSGSDAIDGHRRLPYQNSYSTPPLSPLAAMRPSLPAPYSHSQTRRAAPLPVPQAPLPADGGFDDLRHRSRTLLVVLADGMEGCMGLICSYPVCYRDETSAPARPINSSSLSRGTGPGAIASARDPPSDVKCASSATSRLTGSTSASLSLP